MVMVTRKADLGGLVVLGTKFSVSAGSLLHWYPRMQFGSGIP